jgi:nicotinamidase/pyrazinamidase
MTYGKINRAVPRAERYPGDLDCRAREVGAVVDYDRQTALLVIDVQNDFASHEGSLHVKDAAAAISAINDEIERASRAGALVVYTQDWHPAHTLHCVADSWGAELHADLAYLADAPRVRKGVEGDDGYSGFNQRDPETGKEMPTELETILREHDIERVVVVGLTTDYCVKETVLDARDLGFETVVVQGAIRAVNLEPGDGDRAIEAMREAGATIA